MSEDLEHRVSQCNGPYTVPVHANTVTAIGVGLEIGSFISLFLEDYASALYQDVAASLCDFFDGKVARKHGGTKQGARLDPLADKLKNVLIGTYIITQELTDNPALVGSILINFALDYANQRQRGPIWSQLKESVWAVINYEKCIRDLDKKSTDRANNFGKWKTGLQIVSRGAYIASLAFSENVSKYLNINQQNLEGYIKEGCTALFIASAVLGSIGLYKKWQEAKDIQQISGNP